MIENVRSKWHISVYQVMRSKNWIETRHYKRDCDFAIATWPWCEKRGIWDTRSISHRAHGIKLQHVSGRIITNWNLFRRMRCQRKAWIKNNETHFEHLMCFAKFSLCILYFDWVFCKIKVCLHTLLYLLFITITMQLHWHDRVSDQFLTPHDLTHLYIPFEYRLLNHPLHEKQYVLKSNI